MIRSVVIIGSGNLAEALARAVAASPLGLRQVFGRNRDRVAAWGRAIPHAWPVPTSI